MSGPIDDEMMWGEPTRTDGKKKYVAVCHIVDRHGRICKNENGKLATVTVEIEGYNRAAALARLPKGYIFKEWW
jgi:hypothetical protein